MKRKTQIEELTEQVKILSEKVEALQRQHDTWMWMQRNEDGIVVTTKLEVNPPECMLAQVGTGETTSAFSHVTRVEFINPDGIIEVRPLIKSSTYVIQPIYHNYCKEQYSFAIEFWLVQGDPPVQDRKRIRATYNLKTNNPPAVSIAYPAGELGYSWQDFPLTCKKQCIEF